MEIKEMGKNKFTVKQITPNRNNKDIPLELLSTIKLHMSKKQALDLISKMMVYLTDDSYEDWIDLKIWRKWEQDDGSYGGTIMVSKRKDDS